MRYRSINQSLTRAVCRRRGRDAPPWCSSCRKKTQIGARAEPRFRARLPHSIRHNRGPLPRVRAVTDLLAALLLGVIEGITEFLPISSTGHLLIAEHWLGARSELFNVAIQAGAILAVVLIYWRRLLDMTLHLTKRENLDYALKLAAAFVVTVAGGLGARRLGLELPETVAPVAWALIVGGIAIFGIEAYAA